MARCNLNTTPAQQDATVEPEGSEHPKKVLVAFGSNVGDRISYIENALQSMRARGLEVNSISPVYETEAMYYKNQPSFLNGVVMISTALEPLKLLDLLQEIEFEQGRERLIDKGPRTLDLDIIYYQDVVLDNDRLQIPHPRAFEREFVLRPLADIAGQFWLPTVKSSVADGSTQGQAYIMVNTALRKCTEGQAPHESAQCLTFLTPKLTVKSSKEAYGPTKIMSILNLTPDSFSDGGVNDPANIVQTVKTVQAHIRDGATIIDVGGQSTRPGADFISAEEELKRILPALQAIRASIPEVQSGQVAISIDTFHAAVARVCLQEGLADIINDVSGGKMDSDMLPTVAEFKKTIVLMHMRGTPQTMNSIHNVISRNDPVSTIRNELRVRVKEAQKAGIPPWRIILDPGIGFSKNMESNLEILRLTSRMTTDILMQDRSQTISKLPWLVGPSRKRFIQRIIGEPAMDPSGMGRMLGTAVCIDAAIRGGAKIVRVHDVKEMAIVSRMADAVWRNIVEEGQEKAKTADAQAMQASLAKEKQTHNSAACVQDRSS